MGQQTPGHFDGSISIDAREIHPPAKNTERAKYPSTLFVLVDNVSFIVLLFVTYIL